MEQETADCLSISAAEHNSSVKIPVTKKTEKYVIANFLALHIPSVSANYFARDKFLFEPSCIEISNTRVFINYEKW